MISARLLTAFRKPEATVIDPEEQLVEWFTKLKLVIPDPEPIALRWLPDGGCIEIAASEAVEDEDLVIEPDMPDLAELAAGCVGMVREADRKLPGPWSYKRWKITSKMATWLYVLGVSSGGGAWVSERGIHWTELPPLHSVWRHKRCYVLGLPMWWWECQKRQGFKIRGRHRPEPPFVFGICAACMPCPECGAHRECERTCKQGGWVEEPA